MRYKLWLFSMELKGGERHENVDCFKKFASHVEERKKINLMAFPMDSFLSCIKKAFSMMNGDFNSSIDVNRLNIFHLNLVTSYSKISQIYRMTIILSMPHKIRFHPSQKWHELTADECLNEMLIRNEAPKSNGLLFKIIYLQNYFCTLIKHDLLKG